MHLKIAAIGAAGMLMATSAQAVPVKVELWDVYAQYPTVGCACAENPTIEQQEAARTGGTNAELHNRTSTYLQATDAIIANHTADALFYIDSGVLADGRYVAGLTGLGGDPTINDFFGETVDGVGGNSMLGTILRLTGLVDVTQGQTFDVRSDDGYRVTIGGDVYAEVDDLQAPTTTTHTYSGVDNPFAFFEMVWFETQRTEAALMVASLDFNPTIIPLPAGLPLLLGGLGALGVIRWRGGRKAA